MKLRPYQANAVDAVLCALAKGKKSVLLVLPTGTGKTVTFAHIAHRQPKRVLVVAHRQELIHQAAEKLLAVTGEEAEIEMADSRADAHIFRRAKFVVASKDTLRGPRLKRFDPAEFSLVVTDEAHHCVADSYQAIYSHFDGTPHVGVTATPDRHDEAALGRVFESVAFVYELPDAIKDGWLCPITQRTVRIAGLDYSKCRTTAGDLNGRDLSDCMANEEVLQAIANVTIQEAKWKKSLIFAPPGYKSEGGDRFRVSDRLTEILNRHQPNSARLITGETPGDERRQVLADFRENQFQFLVNVGVFTEGFDDPSIEMVVMARATKSRALYSQMVGRGTRPLPGVVDPFDTAAERRAAIAQSPKPTCEVLDLQGNAGAHKLIHTGNILGGNYTEEEIERAEKLAKVTAGAVDMSEKLEEARRVLELQREAERKRRKNIVGQARYTTEIVDPFDILQVDPPVFRGWDVREPASEKQAVLLKRFGVDHAESFTKRQASVLLQRIFDRRDQGRCSFSQAKRLAQHGLSTDCSFAEAKAMLNEIDSRRTLAIPRAAVAA